MAYDIPSISDLEAIQLLNKHYAEVITSKKDGVSSAADITRTTNPITGVTRRTLYKILDDMDDTFLERLLKMAFTPVGTFTAGATLTDARQTLLWEVSQGGDGHYYSWSGTFPKAVTAGSSPSPIEAGSWVDRTDDSLRNEIRETVFQNMKRLAAEAGYNLVDGSFEEGANISGWPDVVWRQTDGKYYQWHLDEAKTIPAGSTPATSGGIGVGAWVDRTDVSLRHEINVVVKTFNTLSGVIEDSSLVIGQKVRTLGYYNIFDDGGCEYEIVEASSGVHDGGSFIDLPASGLQAKAIFNDVALLQQFGAKDGNTNDATSEIQSWVSFICSNNNIKGESTGRLEYYISNPIILSGDFWKIYLNGTSIFKTTTTKSGTPDLTTDVGVVSTDVDAVFVAPTKCTNFVLDGGRGFIGCKDSGNGSTSGIFIAQGSSSSIDNFYITYVVNGLWATSLWLNHSDKITVRDFTGKAFFWDSSRVGGGSGSSGTSLNLTNLYASNGPIAYSLNNVVYSTLTSLSADAITDTCYDFRNCHGFTCNSLGAEGLTGKLLNLYFCISITFNALYCYQLSSVVSGVPLIKAERSNASFQSHSLYQKHSIFAETIGGSFLHFNAGSVYDGASNAYKTITIGSSSSASIKIEDAASITQYFYGSTKTLTKSTQSFTTLNEKPSNTENDDGTFIDGIGVAKWMWNNPGLTTTFNFNIADIKKVFPSFNSTSSGSSEPVRITVSQFGQYFAYDAVLCCVNGTCYLYTTNQKTLGTYGSRLAITAASITGGVLTLTTTTATDYVWFQFHRL